MFILSVVFSLLCRRALGFAIMYSPRPNLAGRVVPIDLLDTARNGNSRIVDSNAMPDRNGGRLLTASENSQ